MWKVDSAKIITAEQKSSAARAAALASYKVAFDAHLDAVAQSRQYDNRLTIVAYASSTNAQWAAEAAAFIAWRDEAMLYMFQQLSAVEAGAPAPSVVDFIGGIAPIDWAT
jgi:hypothetical protein